jgi:hypothetical protein
MRLVVHGVLEDHSNDPFNALDTQKRYELSDSAAAEAWQWSRMSLERFRLHRIAAVSNSVSVCGLATMLWRATVPLSLFALRLQHRTRSFLLRWACACTRIRISNITGARPERLAGEIHVMRILGGRPTRQHKSNHARVDRQKRDQRKTLNKVDLNADFAAYIYSGWPIPSRTTSIVSKQGGSQTWVFIVQCT